MKQVKHIEFKTLKHSYGIIKAFLVDESGMEIGSLNDRIAQDLSMFGNDNYALLIKFVRKYKEKYFFYALLWRCYLHR